MKSSTHMEHSGLVNALNFLEDNSVEIESLITKQSTYRSKNHQLTIVMMFGMLQKVLLYCINALQ